VKSFVPGEGFAYLGRSYRLALDDAAEDVRLDRGRFVMSADTARDGRNTMRRWYITAGQRWLQRRVIPWTSRAGIETVEIDVSDLGYRWGSVRPTETPARINIHWATLQLPPSLIDYVLAHELAHLFEPNHISKFWAIVGRLMPGYDARKASLASIGKNVWLGQT
jgi:predicted metal-dependent hydrolase